MALGTGGTTRKTSACASATECTGFYDNVGVDAAGGEHVHISSKSDPAYPSDKLERLEEPEPSEVRYVDKL